MVLYFFNCFLIGFFQIIWLLFNYLSILIQGISFSINILHLLNSNQNNYHNNYHYLLLIEFINFYYLHQIEKSIHFGYFSFILNFICFNHYLNFQLTINLLFFVVFYYFSTTVQLIFIDLYKLNIFYKLNRLKDIFSKNEITNLLSL